jgi:hypothetical protein
MDAIYLRDWFAGEMARKNSSRARFAPSKSRNVQTGRTHILFSGARQKQSGSFQAFRLENSRGYAPKG